MQGGVIGYSNTIGIIIIVCLVIFLVKTISLLLLNFLCGFLYLYIHIMEGYGSVEKFAISITPFSSEFIILPAILIKFIMHN